MSVAKAELMLLDTVRVEYDNPNKKDPKKKLTKPNDRSIALNEESVRKALERRKKEEWTKMSFSDLDKLTKLNTDK